MASSLRRLIPSALAFACTLGWYPGTASAAEATVVVTQAGDGPTIAPQQVRLLDTRVDDHHDRLDAGSVLRLDLGDRVDLPATARSALVNVVAVQPSGTGHLRVDDCTSTPSTSAWICMQSSLRVTPPSTLSTFKLTPESAAIASTTSRLW